MNTHVQSAVFAGGCFWCTEAVFLSLKGVLSVLPGYSGGTVPHPTYEQVSSGTSGHAEAVQITFDESVVTFRDLLEVFFATHDPTTKNRQGNDTGPQYRSVVFYMNDRQRDEARQVIAELEQSHAYENPVVTEIEPFVSFYEAEDYHANYFARNPGNPYCQFVIGPKLRKLREKFAEKLM